MHQLDIFESMRLKLQKELDAKKTQKERNRLGQYATPTNLAVDILAFAKDSVSPNTKVRFLDPAFGTGAFYSALLKIFRKSQIEKAVGYEIDTQYGYPTAELWSNTIIKIFIEDFTKANSPIKETEKYNLIICNPPYVRHHHINKSEKTRLQYLTKKIYDVHLNGLAGLYCYFMILSHDWMAKKGIAGWLVPSEFMDVNYGDAVKKYLITNVSLMRIHRFNPNEVQFDDALVSSALVWFRKDKPSPSHKVEFSFGRTLENPEIIRKIPIEILKNEPKWTRFPRSEIRVRNEDKRLGDFFEIKRGLATGDNKFFILDMKEIEKRRLPKKFFRPILPSPRYLATDEISADEEGNPLIDKKLFLLDCRLSVNEIKKNHPNLWDYLEEGQERGVHNRYLCKHRDPWYLQEKREPTNLLLTYMGRKGNSREMPFRFILNHSNAIAANVYLLMYPKGIFKEKLNKNPNLIRKVWNACKRISADTLIEEGRYYGGGLVKMEPRELSNVSAHIIINSIFV